MNADVIIRNIESIIGKQIVIKDAFDDAPDFPYKNSERKNFHSRTSNELYSNHLEIDESKKHVTLYRLIDRIHKIITYTKIAIGGFEIQQINRILNFASKFNTIRGIRISGKYLESFPESLLQINGLEYLDLSSNSIKYIPDNINLLSNLRHLDISSNDLCELPENIGLLKNIEKLYFSENMISYFPKSLNRLNQIRFLGANNNKISFIEEINNFDLVEYINLSNNLLEELPESISELTTLKYLVLRNNQINKLPNSIGKLSNLKYLYLNNNLIEELPESIGRLGALQLLHLDNNKLIKLPRSIVRLNKNVKLNIRKNYLVEPPIEIARKGIKEIKEYYFSLLNDRGTGKGTVIVYEAKLMIVGEPGAGKTSLCKKLENPLAPLQEKSDTTKGIDIVLWKYCFDGNEYIVNIWDFGGQEIYRSTHQFFMSERVLYVLLADSREEDTDYFDWLHRINLFAGESPVIIVHNEVDDRLKNIDMSLLRKYFPNVNKPLRCNLAKVIGTDREHDYNNIINTIKQRISNLEVIGQEFSKTWVEIRKTLEDIASTRDFISATEYYLICRKQGVEKEGAIVLGDYLHTIGAILYFKDDKILKNIVILKPEWGTKAVYKVIDDSIVQSAFGRFSLSDAKRIWADDKYKSKCYELLQLMKKFRICYNAHEKDYYILPQLLEYPPEDYLWENTADLHFEYQYSGYYLKSIMYYFIVAMHQYIDGDKVWRNCVVLKNDLITAEVKAYENKRTIHIRVGGLLCNDFLANIRYEFEKIHDEIPLLKYESMVPCNCSLCSASDDPAMFRYSELQDRLKHRKETIECSKNQYCEISIKPLIREFSTDNLVEYDALMAENKVNEVIKELEKMKNSNNKTVINNYGNLQYKGKDNKMEANTDDVKEQINELKGLLISEDLDDKITIELLNIIKQFTKNNYYLEGDDKISIKDKLRNILKGVANVATVAGVVTQLITMIG